MTHQLSWQTIILLCPVFMGCHAIHAQIKSYTNVTTNECGLGRHYWTPDSDDCFRYSKANGAAVENGRPIGWGEMPWLVGIKTNKSSSTIDKDNNTIVKYYPGSCSGVIINEWWIVTARHCLYGNSCRAISAHIDHAAASLVNDSPDNIAHFHVPGPTTDIALVKLRDKIEFNLNDTTKPMVNAICFPKESIYNKDPEYALISGYGSINETLKDIDKFGHMGWMIIHGGTNDAYDGYGRYIYMTKLNNDGHFLCQGDSGDPLIQYVNGRAVLIGVNVYADNDNATCSGYLSDRSWSIRVSRKMDFILNNIYNRH